MLSPMLDCFQCQFAPVVRVASRVSWLCIGSADQMVDRVAFGGAVDERIRWDAVGRVWDVNR